LPAPLLTGRFCSVGGFKMFYSDYEPRKFEEKMMKTIYRTALIGVLFLILIMTINNTVFAGGKTIPQIIGEAKSQTTEITVDGVKKDMVAGRNFILLDVRTSEEFKAGHLPKAVNIPRGTLEFMIGKHYPQKARAALCAKTLSDMGYTNVKNLKGAFKAWGEAGYPIYNRHGEFKMISFEKKE
jgi:rhodanese-related sulfurtransferase